jgi:hypothetical protein
MLGSNVTTITKVQLKQAEAVVLGCRTNVGGGRIDKISKLSPYFASAKLSPRTLDRGLAT